ncbi:DUF6350 family protein [Amycolatopsis sp.]|uniref:cell division protein PerM n=1 Tax=Amycolatopsis sp. TaxID=37632 RepID=UPI002E07D7A5|nr:DUF6350 family protein [Amycolatopsis sp.]
MDLLTPSALPPGDERLSDPEPGFDLSRATRVRVLLAAALGPLITGYALVAAVFALVTVTADRTRFSTLSVLASAGPGWLAAHQVPLDITGHRLGMLPLLPAIGVAVLIARTAAGAAQRLGLHEPRQAIAVVAVLTGAHALFGLVIALISRGGVFEAEAVTAFFVPGLFAALAATAGLAKRAGLISAAQDYLDPLALRGIRAGVLGLAGLLASGAVVFTLSLALSTSTLRELYEPGFGTSFGLFLLSLGYLPNAIVAGLSFAAGPGFSMGTVTVGPLDFSGGSVPGVPLLAGIPDHRAAWWPVLVLLPAAVGVLVGWSVRNVDAEPVARLRTVGVAGAIVGFGCVVLGTLAGGQLGDGPFDPVSVPVGVASVVAFCWIVIPGGMVAFFAGPHEPPAPPDETAEGAFAEADDSEETEADETEGTELEDGEAEDSELTDELTDDAADELVDDELSDDEEIELDEELLHDDVVALEESDEFESEVDVAGPEPAAGADVTESTAGSVAESEPEPDR